MSNTQTLIYIGASLPRGRLQRFTVFKDGLTPYAAKLAAEYPALRQLIVPLSRFRDALAELAKTGSRLHEAQRLLNEQLKPASTSYTF